MNENVKNILDKIKSREFKSISDNDIEKFENELNKKEKNPADYILLRGSIEIALRDSINNKEIKREKGDNVVLYVGRSWLMQKIASSGMDSTILVNANLIIGNNSTPGDPTQLGPQGYFTYKTGTLSLTPQTGGTGQPFFAVNVSWESTQLTNTGFNAIWEFLLNNSTGSAGTFLCRYVSSNAWNATTSNQLLITYTVFF